MGRRSAVACAIAWLVGCAGPDSAQAPPPAAAIDGPETVRSLFEELEARERRTLEQAVLGATPSEARRLAAERYTRGCEARARALAAEHGALGLRTASLLRLTELRVSESERLTTKPTPDAGSTPEELDARLRAFLAAELPWIVALDATERAAERDEAELSPEERADLAAVRESARIDVALEGRDPAGAEERARSAAAAWLAGRESRRSAEERAAREDQARSEAVAAERGRRAAERDAADAERARRKAELDPNNPFSLLYRGYDAVRDVGDLLGGARDALLLRPRLGPRGDRPARPPLTALSVLSASERMLEDRRCTWLEPDWEWAPRHRAVRVAVQVSGEGLEPDELVQLARGAELAMPGRDRGPRLARADETPTVVLELRAELSGRSSTHEVASRGALQVRPVGTTWSVVPRVELGPARRAERPWTFLPPGGWTSEVAQVRRNEARRLGWELVEQWLRRLAAERP